MTRRSLLLVEDDPSLQRFFVLALSELDLEVQCCSGVDAAITALQARSFDLIVSDLMLQGRSGFELIEALVQTPDLRAGAELMAFSAGLSANVRQRLEALGVRRVLAKPCTVGALESAVSDALRHPTSSTPSQPKDGRPDAVDDHFGGDQTLYDIYRRGCLSQFVNDILAGDAACSAGDAPGLHRLAHNLKSVLLILGHPQPAALARTLEDCAAAAQWEAAKAAWQGLREQMRALK